MNSFTLLFLAALTLNVAFEWWLNYRHRRHIALHKDEVPTVFQDRLTPEDHLKAADYTVARARLGLVDLFAGALILLGLTVMGGLNIIDQFWRANSTDPLLQGTGFAISVVLLLILLQLPFSLYRTFVIEQKFGFNRSTVATWVVDLVKSLVLLALLGIPLIWLVLWLMQDSGPLWWLYVWIVLELFFLFLIWAGPALILPMFNKFEPLADEELKQRITRLIEQCGFRSNGVFVMDGSRRSTHSNAYFAGIGNNKRIVFYDTLLDQLDPDEIEAVLAHELGHFKLNHIRKGFFLSALFNLAGLAILGWLIAAEWFYAGLVPGSTPSNHLALVLFYLALPVFTFVSTPLMSWLSRKREFEADDFAAGKRSAAHLVAALVKLKRENASTVTPDPLYSMIHDSHPPAMIRIANLNRHQGNEPDVQEA